MAGRTPKIANAQVAGFQGTPRFSLLYLRGGSAERIQATDRHHHPYWQLELLTAPGARIELDETAFALRRGDCLVLPPGCAHRFTYRPGAAWFSLRYTIADAVETTWTKLREADSPALAPCRQLLTALYPQALADPAQAAALEQAAMTLLALVHRSPQRDHRDPLVARVDDAIAASNGRHLSVITFARRLGYARNYLCSRYKVLSGRSLKEHLDTVCAHTAGRMLRYDDRGIAEIAEALGFPDAYGFSRFFLRVTGSRPTAWRAQTRGD